MWTDLGWFIYQLDIQIWFWSLAAWPPTFLYLSFFTLYSSSLWRTDTIVRGCRYDFKLPGKYNISRQGIKQLGISFGSFLTMAGAMIWSEIPGPRLLMTALIVFSNLNKPPGALNRGFMVINDLLIFIIDFMLGQSGIVVTLLQMTSNPLTNK